MDDDAVERKQLISKIFLVLLLLKKKWVDEKTTKRIRDDIKVK